jgi:predicted dehydrogenase
MASKCTVLEVPSPGTSGGWASYSCVLTRTIKTANFSTHYVAPGDGDLARFQPAAGITMSFDDLKIVEANSLVQSLATGKVHGASVDDALHAAEIIEAMAESARSRRWVMIAQ